MAGAFVISLYAFLAFGLLGQGEQNRRTEGNTGIKVDAISGLCGISLFLLMPEPSQVAG